MASAGPEANVQLAIQDNGHVNETGESSLPLVFHDTGLQQQHRSGEATSDPWQRELSETQCQLSTEGALKCPPLYCKKIVMNIEAKGAEQKQKGKGMYIP